ncbi:hypothetical protein TrST_g14030 [Triparma strigata]|uniref:Chloride channel protein n=1 Tax=Triparma strigata TaxID=1606541 RepID=A0A9W7EZL4_9STRA|nr:hypothetical protein TrST_g14030 [Triparma strigata]
MSNPPGSPKKNSHSDHINESYANLPTVSRRISLIILIGIVVGIIEYLITSLLSYFLQLRFDFVQQQVDKGDMQFLAILYILPAMTLVASVVSYLSPISAGSALPEIKGYLNGAHIPGIFGVTCLIVKAIGVTIAISCGFPVGREGPMVQVGCAVANQTMKIPFWKRALIKDTGVTGGRKEVEAEEIDKEKTLLLTIGGAAGISAAFRSPIGGVLYMMEDMASYWNHETTVRAFGCTMTATLVYSLLLDASHNKNYEALILFEDIDHKDWLTADIPWFMILAVFTGCLSVCYSELLFFFQHLRKTRTRFRSPMEKTIEVTICSFVICMVPLYIGSLFGCKELPADMKADDHWGGLARFECEVGSYNDMASLWLMGEEGGIKELYSRDESKTNVFSVETLALFIVVFLLLGGFTGGLAIPFGTFVPNLFMGAAFGRMFALIVQEDNFIGVKGLSSPGTYALIGAGSMLGGYTRMTLTVVIMIAEASGDISIVMPLMVAVQISRWVANFLTEAYDHKMMELRRIPFLHDTVDKSRRNQSAGDVMIPTQPLNRRECLKKLRTIIEQDNLMRSAYPIVDNEGYLLGLVHGLVLESVLIQGFEDDENDEDMLPMEAMADPSPFTVFNTFPLSKLFPLFRKLQVEHVVVLSSKGKPIGYIPRTCLVDHDGGEVETNHHKAMSHLDMTGTARNIRRQSTGSNAPQCVLPGSPGTKPANGFESGELYDDHLDASANLRKLTSWLSPGKIRTPSKEYIERDSTTSSQGARDTAVSLHDLADRHAEEESRLTVKRVKARRDSFSGFQL